MAPVPGTAVTVTLEGRRPLVTEVQALVGPSAGSPRRTTSGLDGNRVAMVVAVLERRGGGAPAPGGGSRVGSPGGTPLGAPVGGAGIADPAADLAVAMAMASAVNDEP